MFQERKGRPTYNKGYRNKELKGRQSGAANERGKGEEKEGDRRTDKFPMWQAQ